MDSVNPMNSATSLFTNESSGQTRSTDERNPLAPSAPPQQQQDGPRVNEGPSAITTISPQAQQLAQQEQSAGNDSGNPPPTNPPPSNDGQQTDRSDAQTASQPAEQSNNAPPPDQSGRAFDDQSPNSLLRN